LKEYNHYYDYTISYFFPLKDLGFADYYEKNNDLRGLELNGNQDSFSISNNQKTIDLNLYTDIALDEVRIITAVPIPSSIFTLGAGIVTLFVFIGIRKKYCF